ncbi:MAG: hypothetical protein KJ072_12730 [Verrucomicrobia bacterium]|nr:hypothetical protein [Verrucomicrobiota bacterium]
MKTRSFHLLRPALLLALSIANLAAQSLVIDTAVGSGVTGYTGDGGPATSASLSAPRYLAADTDGTLYFSDFENYCVRKVDAVTGVVTTLVTLSDIDRPRGLAFDASGNLYVVTVAGYAERGFVKRIDKQTGTLTTVADLSSFGLWPGSLAIDVAGNFYVTDTSTVETARSIRKWDPVTQQLTTVVSFGGNGWLFDLKLDGAGNLYVAYWNFIKRYAKDTWAETTVAGTGSHGFAGDGGLATAAMLYYPRSLALDADGNVLIADTANNRIRRVDHATGVITTVAGNGADDYAGEGGAAAQASLSGPQGVAVDRHGRIWVADTGNAVIRGIFPGNPVSGAPARVVTGPATMITPTTATIAGIVTGDGGSAITERGIVFSTSANPTIGLNTKVVAAAGTGRFSVRLTALAKGTNYHVRAYAVNSAGTAYGDDKIFTTSSIPGQWTKMVAPAGAVTLRRVFADGKRVWIIADRRIYFSSDYPATPLVVQCEAPNGSLSDFCFRRIGGKWSAWAAGGNRTGFRTTDAEAGEWTPMSFKGSGYATEVSFPTDTLGYLTDQQGLMQKTVDGGQTWTVIPFPSDYTQRISLTGSSSMVFLDETTGYSVDAEPRVAITTDGGATWEDAGAAVAGALGGLCFRSSTLGWAVGNSGQILRYVNGTWEDSLTNPDPDERFLTAVHFSTDTDGWTVGVGGVMLHTADAGSTWSLQDTTTTEWLLDVFFVSPDEGYAVGANGTILRYAVEHPAVTAPTLSIAAADTNVILSWPAVATNFTLTTTPQLAAGAVWTAVTNPPSLLGTNQVVTNTAAGPSRYYRLQTGL